MLPSPPESNRTNTLSAFFASEAVAVPPILTATILRTAASQLFTWPERKN